MKRDEQKEGADGVFFSEVDGMKSDAHLHGEMLEEVASVADEAGIRALMNSGMTREEACRLILPRKPEGKVGE